MRKVSEPSASEHHLPRVGGAGYHAEHEHDVPPPLGLRLITSVLLFGLLCEWVLPLRHLSAWTDLTRVDVVVGAIAFALASGCVILSWRKLPLVLAGGLVVAVPWLFYGINEIGSWLPRMADILRADLDSVLARQWVLSAELRTGVLLAGCMALSCACQSLMWLRYWGAGLALATGLFLLNLEWWFGHDALLPLVRVVCTGGLLTVVLAYCRQSENRTLAYLHQAGRPSGLPLQGLGAAALAVALLLGAGWWAAAAKPAAGGPAPWAAGMQEQGEAWLLSMAGHQSQSRARGTAASDLPGRIAQIGYGADDGRLGAPLAMNDTLVFIADTTAPVAYWRGEAKPFYDGRGWSVPFEERLESPLDRSFAEDRAEEADGARGVALEEVALPPSEDIRVRLTYAGTDTSLPMFTAGVDTRVLQISAAGGQQASLSYLRDLRSDSLFPAGDRTAIATMELESRIRPSVTNRPAHSGELAAPSEPGRAKAPALTDALQLPVSVTDRTAELARNIAASAGSDDYARAAAIERYLKERYRYTLDETAVPPQGQDFVDHFLFEQEAGYCVHFASAMTIMLRTLDIPARWVKGFTGGTTAPIEQAVDTVSADSAAVREQASLQPDYSHRAYIRSRDAHAWVEVYVAGSGWVVFDPTPAAARVALADAAAASMSLAAAGASAVLEDGETEPLYSVLAARARAASAWSASRVSRGWQTAVAYTRDGAESQEAVAAAIRSQLLTVPVMIWVIGCMFTAGAAFILWRMRGRLALAISLYSYERAWSTGRPSRRRLLAVTRRSWLLIERAHGPRQLCQTAREYVASLTVAVPAATRLALLARWEERARFETSGWQPPEPAELKTLISGLTEDAKLRRGGRGTTNSLDSFPGGSI